MTYESIKQLTATFHGSSSPTSPGPVAVAGGLCGLVSWATVGLSIPPQPPLYRASLTRTCADVSDRYGQIAISARLPVRGQGQAGGGPEDRMVPQEDVSRYFSPFIPRKWCWRTR